MRVHGKHRSCYTLYAFFWGNALLWLFSTSLSGNHTAAPTNVIIPKGLVPLFHYCFPVYFIWFFHAG